MKKYLLIIFLTVLNLSMVPTSSEATRIVFLTGPDSHAYGAHDFEAGARYIAQCLNQAVPAIDTRIVLDRWPEDSSILEEADAVIIYCDGLEDHIIEDQHRALVDQLRERGVGLGFLHYACAAEKDGLGLDMLRWAGGYYETFWTVNPQWDASFNLLPPHPLTRGVVPFDLYGEWYFNMRFRENMDGIIPILTSIPPDHARLGRDGAHTGNPYVRTQMGMPEHLSWVVEDSREQRGFVLTGLHYYWNLGHPGLRKLILNACLWLAGMEVPDDGVRIEPVSLSELESLNPATPDEQWLTRARTEWEDKFSEWNSNWAQLSGANSKETGRFTSFRKQVLSSGSPEADLIEAISGKDVDRARWAFELFLDGIAVKPTAQWLKMNIMDLSPDRQLMSLYALQLLKVPDIDGVVINLSRTASGNAQTEAIRLLGSLQRKEDLDFLMEQAVSGDSGLEEAAMTAFGRYTSDVAEGYLNDALLCSDKSIQLKAIEIVLAREEGSATRNLLVIAGQEDNSNNSAAIRAVGKVAPLNNKQYRQILDLFIASNDSPLKKDWQMAVWELSRRQPDYAHALSIIEECKKESPESMQRVLTGLGRKLMSLL